MGNGLDEQYIDLLKDVLENGVEKNTRNGKVLSVFGRTIRYKFKDGKFPLITTKKMAWKTMVTELLWFLRGNTNIKYLVDNGCHIWDGDCYSNYIKEVKKVNPVTGNLINLNYPEDILTHEEFINKIKTDDEFAQKWGELGPIYGKQWRCWKKPNHFEGPCSDEYTTDTGFITKDEYEEWKDNYIVDQIQNLINDLKTNPDSRRLMVNAWNVGELDQMVLPPCHFSFQVYTRELTYKEKIKEARKRFGFELEDGTRTFDINTEESIKFLTSTQRAISLMFNMRSNDVPLGLPFNIASYALLLEIFGKMVNMIPDELIVNLGDAHIYKNQIDGVKEQIIRDSFELPTLVIDNNLNFKGTIDEFLDSCDKDSFKLEGYKSHPTIKFPLSN